MHKKIEKLLEKVKHQTDSFRQFQNILKIFEASPYQPVWIAK